MTLQDLIDITHDTEWIIRSNGFIQGSYMSANKIPDRYLLCKIKSIRVLRYEIEVNIEEDYVLW